MLKTPITTLPLPPIRIDPKYSRFKYIFAKAHVVAQSGEAPALAGIIDLPFHIGRLLIDSDNIKNSDRRFFYLTLKSVYH